MASVPTVTVIHPRLPGPWSPSPRDRQVAHRIADLLATGFEVAVVAVEPHAAGGAPATLTDWGAELVDATAGPATLADRPGVLWLTDLSLGRAWRDAVAAHPGPLVLDLDELPSARAAGAVPHLPAPDRPGMHWQAERLAEQERPLLDRAALVLGTWPEVVDELAAAGAAARLLPPTVPGRAEPPVAPGTGIVHPGRWSDELLTPDETALRIFLTSVSALGLTTRDVVCIGEDVEPRLRAPTQGRTTQASVHDATARLLGARLALGTRFGGAPTAGRLAELAAIGLPFVTSPTALGSLGFGPLPTTLWGVEHHEHLAIARRLLRDDDLWAETSLVLWRWGRQLRPERVRKELAAALADVELLPDASVPGRDPAPVRLTDPPEVHRPPRGGTLADVDERIRRLEDLSVPHRLFGRDDSILTQSFVDDDRRYRQLHATHFQAPRAHLAVEATAPTVELSLLLPTWNTPVDTLTETLESVAAQTYDRWELCIVDDGSTDERTRAVLQRFADRLGPKVKLRLNADNQGISGASNDALALATKEWVVLLDHDDLLSRDALAWVASYVAACPDYDVWYSDEDKVDPAGDRVSAFLKPDWSPDLELAVNYVCHLLVARRALVNEAGGFRSAFDGAQDWDLVLRLTELTDRVGHIARPLYSWRMIEGSTAIDTGAKPKAHHAGHDALVEALERRGIRGHVEDGTFPTTHRVRYAVDRPVRISVLIPTRDRVDLLRSCIDSLHQRSEGLDLEVVVIDNDSSDPATLAYLDELRARPEHAVVRYPHPFSFARQMNLGALEATGELLLMLNNDTTFSRADSLHSMAELALRPEVGLVGAKLMFPPHARDGRPQHEGIVMGMAGLAYNVDLGGYMGLDNHIRNCSAVTAACAMLRTSVFHEVGGMEERLRVAYKDVDFGLRIGEHGYRVLYTPFAELVHPESASRGSLHPMEDEDFFIQRWGPKGAVREPFVSPHFEWMMPLFFRL